MYHFNICLGGWLLIGNANVRTESDAPNYTQSKILSKSIASLQNVTSGRVLLSETDVHSLRSIMNFSQIRVYCHKPSVGRTFHIMTRANSTGYAVVDYVSLKTNGQPLSCGSFTALSDDTSILSRNCLKFSNYNCPSCNKLYDHFCFIGLKNHVIFRDNRKECDDFPQNDKTGIVGTWKYFVR